LLLSSNNFPVIAVLSYDNSSHHCYQYPVISPRS